MILLKIYISEITFNSGTGTLTGLKFENVILLDEFGGIRKNRI